MGAIPTAVIQATRKRVHGASPWMNISNRSSVTSQPVVNIAWSPFQIMPAFQGAYPSRLRGQTICNISHVLKQVYKIDGLHVYNYVYNLYVLCIHTGYVYNMMDYIHKRQVQSHNQNLLLVQTETAL